MQYRYVVLARFGAEELAIAATDILAVARVIRRTYSGEQSAFDSVMIFEMASKKFID